MKKSVSKAPKGEKVMRDLFEPPLNMMSFMILVKFLRVGEDQILFVSGKLILGKNILHFRKLIIPIFIIHMESFFSPLKKK